jgi:thiol-disulfide isomerase/thioredoxin
MVFRHLLHTVKRHCFRTLRALGDGSFLSALTFLMLASAFCLSQPTALDLDGKSVDPLKSNPSQLVVLVFVRGDCPVSARYAPTIQRISDEHRKDAHLYLVFPDKSESPADVRKYLRDFRYSLQALRDPEHALVQRAHAEITPEAAVFDAKGALVYHGRIDNLYETFGRARSAPTTHELEDAIQAAVVGRAPAIQEVAGVGCYISDVQ